MSIINKRVVPNNVNDDLVNEKIRFKEVMVIDKDGTKLGIKMRREALEIAYDQELDLLCVAPNATPPVCKVLDYGRYHFEQQKKAKEAKKKQHVTEIKPLRLSPVIDKHDFDTKMRHARSWIENGMKVKVDMRFRGRLTNISKYLNFIIEIFNHYSILITSLKKYQTLRTLKNVLRWKEIQCQPYWHQRRNKD